jgi:hypothetical protein
MHLSIVNLHLIRLHAYVIINYLDSILIQRLTAHSSSANTPAVAQVLIWLARHASSANLFHCECEIGRQ